MENDSMAQLNGTPRELGYRMPGEFEEQEAIWLSWPQNEETFPNFLPEMEQVYKKYILALIDNQRVNLLVPNEEIKSHVLALLEGDEINKKNLIFHMIPTVDVWIRDYGPTFVVHDKEDKKAMIDWVFNAWGDKYDDLKKDTVVAGKIQKVKGYDYFKTDFILEGGSIDVNGRGTLLTTEQCLLNPNRNSHLNKKEIESILVDYLNLKKIIWLKEGIVGDDTDGHIDDIARFVNESTIVCVVEKNPQDENYEILQENLNILRESVDQDGNPFDIVELPMPKPVIINDIRLPASYANFYIGNKTVVVPIFNDPNDGKALDILRSTFPDREVVGINCRNMVYGLGTLHCSSQQEPKI